MTEFSIDHFRSIEPKDSRFQRRIAQLKASDKYTRSIEKTVIEAVSNVTEKHARSFVIYGEPQSGKTEMMIALTAIPRRCPKMERRDCIAVDIAKLDVRTFDPRCFDD